MPEAGYEIDFLAVSGLDRRNPFKAVAAVGRAAVAVRRQPGGAARTRGGRRDGRRRLRRRPVGLAAVRMGLPLVLTEADSHLGVANRMLRAARAGSAWHSRSPAARASPTC